MFVPTNASDALTAIASGPSTLHWLHQIGASVQHPGAGRANIEQQQRHSWDCPRRTTEQGLDDGLPPRVPDTLQGATSVTCRPRLPAGRGDARWAAQSDPGCHGDAIMTTPDRLRILSALLGMPTAGGLQAIEELAEMYPWLLEPARELRSLPLEQWQREHSRLFVSGAPRTPCPPFESAYRQPQVVDELDALYRRIGVQVADLPADYLGVMLDCAAHLLDPRRRAPFCLWQTLWDQHLTQWVPAFARDLQTHGELLLYRQMGEQLLALFPAPRVCPATAGVRKGSKALLRGPRLRGSPALS